MSDPTPDDAAPDLARPKRTPPTLDLSATEVPRTDAAAEAATDASASAAPRRPSRVLVPALAGAIAGALVAGAAGYAQWRLLPKPARPPAAETNAAAVDDIRARIATLETRSEGAPPAPVDLSELTKRLDALDKASAALREEESNFRSQMAQAVAAANEAKTIASEAAASANEAKISATEAKSTPAPATAVAAPMDLGPIETRLTQLEGALRAQTERAAAQSARPANDLALRRAVVATQLDALVRRGEPYAAMLAAAKPLAADPAALAALDAFAASGVPLPAKLSADFLALPQIAPPPETATSSGLIERMRAGATKLVKIDRTDARPDDNAALNRATAAARRNDVSGAVRELTSLNANDRVAVQPWLDQVAASDAARDAARRFVEQSIAAAAKPTP